MSGISLQLVPSGALATETPPVAPLSAPSADSVQVAASLFKLLPEPLPTFEVKGKTFTPPELPAPDSHFKDTADVFPPKAAPCDPPTDEAALTAAKTEAGPLKVVGFSPSGPQHAPPSAIEVTFSHPMIGITAPAEAAAVAAKLVSISPDVPGSSARFSGPSTLHIEWPTALPLATEFTVTVAAGVSSALGGKLADAATNAFSTPVNAFSRTMPNQLYAPAGPPAIITGLTQPATDAFLNSATAQLTPVGNAADGAVKVDLKAVQFLSTEWVDAVDKAGLADFEVARVKVAAGRNDAVPASLPAAVVDALRRYVVFKASKTIGADGQYTLSPLTQPTSVHGPLLGATRDCGRVRVSSTVSMNVPRHPVRENVHISFDGPIDYGSIGSHSFTLTPTLGGGETISVSAQGTTDVSKGAWLKSDQGAMHLERTPEWLAAESEAITDAVVGTVRRSMAGVYGTARHSLPMGLVPADGATKATSNVQLFCKGIKPKTEYTLTCAASVRSVDGNRLKVTSGKFMTADIPPKGYPHVTWPHGRATVKVDPRVGTLTLPITTSSCGELDVEVYHVDMASISEGGWATQLRQTSKPPGAAPTVDLSFAKKVYSGTLKCAAQAVDEAAGAFVWNHRSIGQLDLEPHLQKVVAGGSVGQLVVKIVPTQAEWDAYVKANAAAAKQQPHHGGGRMGGRVMERASAAVVFGFHSSMIASLHTSGVMSNGHGTAAVFLVDQLTGLPLSGSAKLVDCNTAVSDIVGAACHIGADGRGKIAMPGAMQGGRTTQLVVSDGKGSSAVASLLSSPVARSVVASHGIVDRGVYRASETVRAAFLIRKLAADASSSGASGVLDGAGAYVMRIIDVPYTAKAVIHDSRGTAIEADAVVDHASGTVTVTGTLPAAVHGGTANIQLSLAGTGVGGGNHSEAAHFEIAAFRTPTYKTSMSVTSKSSDGTAGSGSKVVATDADGTAALTATATAALYAGGAVGGAATTVKAVVQSTNYSPPGNGSYTFGTSSLGIFGGRGGHTGGPGQALLTPAVAATTTDADGVVACEVVVDGAAAALRGHNAVTVGVEASILDLDGQRQFADDTATVLMAGHAVGLKLQGGRRFATAKGGLNVEVVVVDSVSGTAVGGAKATVSVTGQTYVNKVNERGVHEYVTETVNVTETVTTDADGHAVVSLKQPGGTYTIKATSTDSTGRVWASSLARVYVSGGWRPCGMFGGSYGLPDGVKQSNMSNVEAHVDKDEYSVGDVAKVLIVAPTPPNDKDGDADPIPLTTPAATAAAGGAGAAAPAARKLHGHVVCPSTEYGVSGTIAFSVDVGGEVVVDVPIGSWAFPRIDLSIVVYGAGAADENELPLMGTTALTLHVSPAAKELAVTAVVSSPEMLPGAKFSVSGSVTAGPHADDVGVGLSGAAAAAGTAHVLVFGVDEAVADLAGPNTHVVDVVKKMYTAGVLNQRSFNVSSAGIVSFPQATTVDTADDNEANNGGGGFGGGAPEMMRCMAAPAGAYMKRGFANDCDDDGGAADGGDGDAGPSVKIRRNFDPSLVFIGAAPVSHVDGSYTVSATSPDNLTSYRVYAVASTASAFGVGTTRVIARRPLMVRASWPRFLTEGDICDVPVVVQNIGASGEPLVVNVAVRAAGAVCPTFAQQVTVSAGGRAAVAFKVAATDGPGVATFQVIATAACATAVADGLCDSSEGVVPVYSPSCVEKFAGYGHVDATAAGAVTAVPITVPATADLSYGGLDVTTSSTIVGELTDAVKWMKCDRATMTCLIADRVITGLVSYGLGPSVPEDARPSASALNSDVGTLVKRWRTASATFTPFDSETSPHSMWLDVTGTVMAAAAVLLAANLHTATSGSGSGSGSGALSGKLPAAATSVLGEIAATVSEAGVTKLISSSAYVWSLTAQVAVRGVATWALGYCGGSGGSFALAAATQAARTLKDAVAAKAEAAGGQYGKAPALPIVEGELFAVPYATDAAAVKAVAASVAVAVSREADSATLVVGTIPSDSVAIAQTSGKVDALLLLALSTSKTFAAAIGDKTLAPAITRGLQKQRSAGGTWRGGWRGPLALWTTVSIGAYVHAFESADGTINAFGWLGGTPAISRTHVGRTPTTTTTTIPMAAVAAAAAGTGAATQTVAGGNGAAANLVVKAQGDGRLYYRVGMETVPANHRTDAVAYGITATRVVTVTDVDGKEVGGPLDAANSTVKVGDRVKVSVTLTNRKPRYHVLVSCPVPGGLEIPSAKLLGQGSKLTNVAKAEAPQPHMGRGGFRGRPVPVRQQQAFRCGGWSGPRGWFTHVDTLDDRVEVYADYVPAGQFVYDFEARVTAAGTYSFGPVHAREAFAPEIYGRSDSFRLTASAV